jgi:hypothetical protein
MTTFLLIDNANFGSIVMDYMRNIYPDINSNLNEKNMDYNLFDHPEIVERYIDTYLYIIYYFNEFHGVPLSNIIFFRDCNHSSNWRKKYIPVYKDGKSRFADSTTYEYFDRKDKLKKEIEESPNEFLKKWNLEDELDELKLKTKRSEKFIHELSSIERFIHFYLNDNLCSLSDRNHCEADEQIFIFAYYLMNQYPNCNIKILSNDTDMIQCITNNNFVHDCIEVCNKRLKLPNCDRTIQHFNTKQIQLFKCFKHSSECFNFKNIKDLYKPHVLDNFLVHKICCGKFNDNLPDPSNLKLKYEWFNTASPDVYKNFNLNKDKCFNSILYSNSNDDSLAKNIKNNIICSSFYYIPKEIIDRTISNCESIEKKIIERDGGFKLTYSDTYTNLFIQHFPKLKRTVINWLEESIVRNFMEHLLNYCSKFIGRFIFISSDIKNFAISDEELEAFVHKCFQYFYYEFNRCKLKWLNKYLRLWFINDKTYIATDEEFNSNLINEPLINFIKDDYKPFIDLIEPYIISIGKLILSKIEI